MIGGIIQGDTISRISGGTVKGKARRAVSVAVVFASTAAVTVVGSETSSAASHSCWRASHSHTITKLRVPLLESGFTYRWCAQNGRIDEFVVESSYSVIRNWVWASDPRADVQPTMSLGQDHLHVYADFSAKSTLAGGGKFKGTKGEVNVSWSPGRLGDHYEIDLWPDGRNSGEIWKG
ncbi:hypothetical protein [Streptomyces sp. NPDC002276]